MFLFILAVWFVIVTLPVWGGLGLIWAGLTFLGKLLSYIGRVISQCFLSEYPDYAAGLLALGFVPFVALWNGVVNFFDPLLFAWDFARYDHPIWAFTISLVLTVYYFSLAHEE